MVPGAKLAPERDSSRAARAAGLPARDHLTLDDVDKRRTQLWAVSIFVLVATTVVLALLSASGTLLPASVKIRGLASWTVIVLVGGLTLAFLIYILEKERNLRRLTHLLVEERVLSTALSNRLTEISTLSEVGKAVNTTLDLQDVLNLILSSALELLGGTEGSIMLLTEEGSELEVVSYHGPRVETVMKGRARVGEGIAGKVAEKREPVLLQGEVGSSKGDRSRGIHSAMCVPLVRRDELLGVLNLSETEGIRNFTGTDLSALGLFAEHAAIAIGNASLFEQERETVARLEELDRLKSDFVATVSHELKTPLSAIIGAARTVARKGPDMNPEVHANFMDMIDRQGNRLLRLIQDVLTTSQIESGAAPARRELIDLKSLAANVIEELHQTELGRDRVIELNANPAKPQIWGNLTSLQQVMVNLVENALKYSDGGSVCVSLTETPAEGLIEVSDGGPGMSDADLQTIFERFRQVDNSSTRKVGGFGLGLYIVKNLVDAHGGTIDVTSDSSGSTFSVHFPKRSSDRGQLSPGATEGVTEARSV